LVPVDCRERRVILEIPAYLETLDYQVVPVLKEIRGCKVLKAHKVSKDLVVTLDPKVLQGLRGLRDLRDLRALPDQMV
jgi:hypothetical protein